MPARPYATAHCPSEGSWPSSSQPLRSTLRISSIFAVSSPSLDPYPMSKSRGICQSTSRCVELVSASLLSHCLQSTKDPIDLVKAEFENVCALSDRDAKHLYLQICHIVTSYSCEYFRVRILSGLPNKKLCLLGVGPHNLLILDEKTKELMGTFMFLSDVKWSIDVIVEKGFFSSKEQKQLRVKFRELPEELVFSAEEGVLEAVDKRLWYHRHHNEEDRPESPRIARSRASSVAAMYRERKASASSAPTDIARSSPAHSRTNSIRGSSITEGASRSNTLTNSASSLNPHKGSLARLNSIFHEEEEAHENGPHTPPGSPVISPSSSPGTLRRHPSKSATLESIRQRLASLNSSATSPAKVGETDAAEAAPEAFCLCPDQPVWL